MKKMHCWAVSLLLCGCLSAFAQITTGRLGGTITDPQGATVPGAEVTVINDETGQRFSALSSERGEWVIPSVPAAVYRVTVALQGFKTVTVRDVKVSEGVPATANVTLQLGELNQTVEVTGGAEILQTTTPTVSSTLVGRQLHELPFTSRNLTELIVTQPGTSTPGVPRSSSINGLPRSSMNITIDGINVQDNSNKTSDGFFNWVQPREDAIEEATVSTAAAGADNTGEGAAQIRFVTRSGTNAFHGGGFWQHRNTALNANYYFNNLNGLPRDRVLLNQAGGRIGGPVIKNKILFFFAYEALRLPQTYDASRQIFTDSARQGIFTYQDTVTKQLRTVNLYQIAGAKNGSLPGSVRAYPTTSDPTLQSSYDLIAQLTSKAGSVRSRGANYNDYNRNDLDFQNYGYNNRDFATTRLDFNVTQKQHIEFIWNYQDNRRLPNGITGVMPVYPGTGVVLGNDVNTGVKNPSFSVVAALRSTITNRLTNEARLGFLGGFVTFAGAVGPSLFTPWKGYAPIFSPYISNPYTASGTSRRLAPVKQFNNNLSYIRSSHVWSFGASFTQANLYQTAWDIQVIPTVTFGIAANDPVNFGATGIFDTVNFPNSSPTNRSDAASLYALLTGRVSAIAKNAVLGEQSKTYGPNATLDRNQQREFALYFQDSWRVHPNLTLTYGVRWDRHFSFRNLAGLYTRPGYDGVWGISGVGNLFKPGVLSGKVPQYLQTTPDTVAWPPKNRNFAPSFGFGWSLPRVSGPLGWLLGHGNSVLRGGYAIATIRPDMGAFTGVWSNNQGRSLSIGVDPVNYPAQFGTPGSVLFRDATLPSRSVAAQPSYPIAVLPGNQVRDYDPNLRMEYVQSWTLGFQRELTRDTVIELRYVGNHAVGMWRQVNLNETNTIENGFAKEVAAAQNNLAIARAATPGSNNFGNQGLAGQQNIPMIATALGATSDVTFATLISQGQAGAVANNIAGNVTRMGRLTAAGYASNLFWANPTATGGAYLVMNGGSASYNAMQFEVRRRMTKGLLVQSSYTWAHALSNIFANGMAANTTTLRNQALDRGPSPWDNRHAFKLNWIYELPFGPTRRFLSNFGGPLGRRVLEGWQLTSVTRIQSGSPYLLASGRLTMNGSDAGVVLNNLSPAQLQDMRQIRKITNKDGIGAVYYLPDALVNNTLAAFEVGGKSLKDLDTRQPYIGPPSTPGQLGSRIYLYGPWQQKWDFSIVKHTRFGENRSVEFRAQILNAFNITNFTLTAAGNPANSISFNSSFGQTTNAYRDLSNTNDPGARMIEFVLRINF